MTEILTVQERTVTFYDPSDHLPEKYKLVLYLVKGEFTCKIGCLKQDGYMYFEERHSRLETYDENVKYWAYLPEFN